MDPSWDIHLKPIDSKHPNGIHHPGIHASSPKKKPSDNINDIGDTISFCIILPWRKKRCFSKIQGLFKMDHIWSSIRAAYFISIKKPRLSQVKTTPKVSRLCFFPIKHVLKTSEMSLGLGCIRVSSPWLHDARDMSHLTVKCSWWMLMSRICCPSGVNSHGIRSVTTWCWSVLCCAFTAKTSISDAASSRTTPSTAKCVGASVRPEPQTSEVLTPTLSSKFLVMFHTGLGAPNLVMLCDFNGKNDDQPDQPSLWQGNQPAFSCGKWWSNQWILWYPVFFGISNWFLQASVYLTADQLS